MPRRVLVHFKANVENGVEARLYIRDGIVLNPHVEERVKTEDFRIVGLRRSGEGYRSLEWDGKGLDEAPNA